MRLSIVMPVYNEKATLEEIVKRVAAGPGEQVAGVALHRGLRPAGQRAVGDGRGLLDPLGHGTQA